MFTEAVSFYVHLGTDEALTQSVADSSPISLCSWCSQVSAIFTTKNGGYAAFQPPGNQFSQLKKIETNRGYVIVIDPQISQTFQGVNGSVGDLSIPSIPAPLPVDAEPDYETSQGYDIILIIGQSNAVGFGSGVELIDQTTNPRIDQFSGRTGNLRQILPASEPLLHPVVTTSPKIVGFPFALARLILPAIPKQRGILLVPCAKGATGFADSSWSPGQPCYEFAISQVKAAIAQNLGNRLIGIVWQQGELDIIQGRPEKLYQFQLDQMIEEIRLNVPGAGKAWFVCGELVKAWADTVGSSGIENAINNLPAREPLSAVVSSRFPTVLGSNPGDLIHFSAPAMRILAERYFARINSAKLNQLGVPPPSSSGLILVEALRESLRLRWDYPEGRVTSWELKYNSPGNAQISLSLPFNGKFHAEGYVLSNLLPGTTYSLSLKAINEYAQGAAVTVNFSTI